MHWAWSALAFHAAFFSRINPAAWLFAGLFLIQAALFVWLGVVRRQLQFSVERSVRHMVAGALVTYALVYPLINVVEGFAFPRMPTFGVPCPTTILTLGLLLAAKPRFGSVAVVPLLWSLIGGSAALLLDVRADLVLFIGAAFLALSLAMTRRHHVAQARPDHPAAHG